ncbi:Re/Si-specific NAD(P)(+) transhydrogenase subunit alpha [candidate division KSB1 bacterium]|nr:Re/Si-specific NAD(P)(+) transhydrogenase subunit alpha [candidate division KSB1 bacterium]
MKIAVAKEILADENRVAMTPDTIKKLKSDDVEIVIQSSAGKLSHYTDEEYEKAGAQIAGSEKELYDGAEVIFKVRPPEKKEIASYPKGCVLVSYLEVLRNPEISNELNKRNITSFAMDTIPRISRAQSMDALSSQASAAGYKAVLLAAAFIRKFLPMLTTAAGTIPPAKVVVLGAGVAGLQAIATARRLGAKVEAYDIRPAAKEEVQSLGAKFIDVTLDEETEAEGGYAKDVSDKSKSVIQQTIHNHVAAADIVITTAQVPGKKAPILVTEKMVKAMQPGSVLVDMAVEQGGNVEGSKVGENVEINGVTIMGPVNLPARMAMDTSQMYARNIMSLFKLMNKEGKLDLNFEDAIIKGACITHDGQTIHEKTKELLNA